MNNQRNQPFKIVRDKEEPFVAQPVNNKRPFTEVFRDFETSDNKKGF